MRILRIQLAGLLMALGAAAAVRAELPGERDWRFERINAADGLPHNAVYTVAQDRTGFLWLGTGSGLARYDGYTFTPFRHDPDRAATGHDNSPSDTDISFLFEDGEGLLWIGTWGGGLDRLDPASETFTHYPSHSEEPGRLRDDRVQIVFEDSRGVLWVGTFAGGLARYERATGTFFSYRHDAGDPASLPDDRVWGIAEDPDGTLWIATGNGLAALDRDSEKFRVLRHDPADPGSLSHDVVRALHVDRQGVLWVGTQDGLNRYDGASGRFTRLLTDDGHGGDDGHQTITTIYEDSRGGFWIGTAHGGLLLLDRAAGTFRQFLYDPTDPESLSDNDIRAVFEDRSQVLWIGTRERGLSKLDLKPRKFSHVTHRPGDPGSLHSRHVRALAEDSDGRLWIGTNSGLERYDEAARRFVLFTPGEGAASLPGPDVHHLFVDRDGQLWAGVWRGGLSRFLGDDEGFETLRHDPENPLGLSSNAVTALAEDTAGGFWVGTDRGLSRLDRRSGEFEHFRHDPGDPRSLADNLIWVIHEESGVLWVGTDSGGLNRFEMATRGFERFQHDPANPQSLSNNRVFTLHRQASGRFWVGTDHGLNEYRGDGTFQRWDGSDGLSDASVFGILSDAGGRLWLSTNGGLTRFDPESGAVRNYTVRDGLQNSQFIAGVALERRDGRLLFGGNNGFNSFHPDRVVDNPYVPPVVLTAFRRFDTLEDLEGSPAAIRRIELTHQDTFFSFEFAALDFTTPRENRFRYKLEGHDRQWVEAGTRHVAAYAGAGAGDYLFRVQASNSDAVWNEEGLTLSVRIEPAWWATWWARSLGGLVLLVGGGALFHRRNRRRQRRERELEESLKQGLAKLRRSEERYRKLFERNVAGVVRAGTDGTILDCNNAFARLFGYASREECLALHQLTFEHGDQRSLLDQLRDRDNYESTARTLDGSKVTLIWNANLVMDESGEGPVIEGTVIDISERRRIEERQRQEQKLESLEMLAGGIAHDLNNLLVGILGNADLARREVTASLQVGEYLDEIEDAAHRAASLATKMLAYSGKGRFVTSDIDLSSAVDEVLLLLTISQRVVIERHLAGDLPAVRADNTQVNQLLINLITNAVEAVGDEASSLIEITTGSRHCDRQYLAETFIDEDLDEGLYAFVEVRDDGPGIAPEVQAKVFDPFVTTKLPGRGLGLPVVLGIVRGHRGALEIDSEPGRGTTVRVWLPATEVRAEKPRPAQSVDDTWSGSGKVLLVDDEALVRNIAQQMLEILGFEVLTASDGDEGVDLFRRHSQDIELVVLDLSMRRMGGEEAFHEIRRIRPDARILLASGYSAQTATERFKGQGLAGFIQKPYQLASFRDKVRDAFGTAASAPR